THWLHAKYTYGGASPAALTSRNGAWYGVSALTGTATGNAPPADTQAVLDRCGEVQSPQLTTSYRFPYTPTVAAPGTSPNGFFLWLQQENAALLKAGGAATSRRPQCINPVNFIDPDPQQDVNGED